MSDTETPDGDGRPPDPKRSERASGGADPRQHRGRRAPRKPPDLTPAALQEAALRYLSRFQATRAMLRRTLRRRLARAAALGATPEALADAEAAVAALVARHATLGLADDAAYAATQAAGRRARGESRRAITARLAAKGVDAETAASALAGADDRDGDGDGDGDDDAAGESAELRAARVLVRRRRLGPYRVAAERAANVRRDLGILARAGFSRAVALAALGTPDGTDDGADRAPGAAFSDP